MNYLRVEKELTVTVTKSTPAAPEGLFWTKSSAGTADGAIYGVDRTMEYSVDGRSTWKAVTGTAITGLRAGEVYIRFAATENTTAGAGATVTNGGPSPILTGVSISRIGYSSTYPEYGQTLRADLTPSDCGNVDFVWLRDGEVIGGATGRSYILTAADIGKTIQVRAVQQSGTDMPVSFTSDATNAVQKAEVSTAPPVPELIEKTATSVKVKPMEGCEFAYCDNSSSEYRDVNGVEITGLSPDTKYRIHARYKDTETTDFYAFSDPLYVKTKPEDSGSSTTPTTTTITGREKVGTAGGALETTVTVEGGTSDDNPTIKDADLTALTEQLKNLLQSDDLQGNTILTDDEKAAVMDGATLTLDMNVKKLDENESNAGAVPAEDKTVAVTAASETAKKIAGNNAQPGDACLFLDITLHKQIDGVDVGTVPEPGADIAFDITAPESMTQNIPENKTRWYFVLCIHNGNAVEVGRSNNPNVHVSSRLFSTYVLTYVDKENSSGGGGSNPPAPGPAPEPEYCTVSFNMLGHGASVSSQEVVKGERATQPVDPKEEGFVFEGWYTSEECKEGEQFSFDTPITADITLYAKWTEKVGQTVYTVSFNLLGHGGSVSSQEVISGNTACKPADPVDADYDFGGWYTSAECKEGEQFSFDTPITADITLYAKWTKKVGPEPEPELRSALDSVPEFTEATTDLFLVKGQKFTIGKGWYVDKKDKAGKSLVSVSKKGLLTAKKAGEVTIYFGEGESLRSLKLHISQPALNKKKTTLTLVSANEAVAEKLSLTNPDELPVYWFSAAPDVATVDQEGNVTAVAKGKAKITAYVNGSAYSCTVTVKEKLTAAERTLHLNVGDTKSLSLPGVKKPVWNSASENIAQMNKNGNKVTAKNAGETVLTATAKDGTEYLVHVIVEDINLSGEGLVLQTKKSGKLIPNKYTLTIKSGDSTQLEFAAVEQAVVFKSSKPESAFIDENGLVSARTAGKSKLTAKINGKTVTVNVIVE